MTIKTGSGTSTYEVTSSSEVEKNGKTTTVGALAVGDTVAFSTVTAAGTTTIDRLIAGNGMAGGCGPGAGHSAPPGGSNSSSSSRSPGTSASTESAA